MAKSEEYRAHAAEMRAFAKAAGDPLTRGEYERMAIAWTMLAEQAEHLDEHPAAAAEARSFSG